MMKARPADAGVRRYAIRPRERKSSLEERDEMVGESFVIKVSKTCCKSSAQQIGGMMPQVLRLCLRRHESLLGQCGAGVRN